MGEGVGTIGRKGVLMAIVCVWVMAMAMEAIGH